MPVKILLGRQFYARQSADMEAYFLDSIFSDIDSLYLYAGVHSIHAGYYRLLASRFPYAIYYKLENNVVRVYAVLDCRQDPDRTRDRLE